MRPHLQLGQTRPRISTMPRQQTEAAAYLDIYKLVNEKKRLQQELAGLEGHRDRLETRLSVIELAITGLEATAHKLRDQGEQPAARLTTRPAPAQPHDHDTMCLEY